MSKGRLEAFSDGVLAIIITIMVLELKAPAAAPNLDDLKPLWPLFLSYVLSFVHLGIYWNNHHHMFQAVHRISSGILWANLHLLFWLSLVPFVTAWMGGNRFAPLPVALYGFVLLMSAIAYHILQLAILHSPGGNPVLAAAIGRDLKGRLSPAIYVTAVALSFIQPIFACGLYALVALIWLIPDRRIERALTQTADHQPHRPTSE
jgi:TMEM175 potassium channel family protein